MASLSDILSALQNGVVAINNFGLQMKGTLNNILSRLNAIAANKETKNYIINGAMMVSQENGATAGATSGYYPVDQFVVAFVGTSGTYSTAQVASATAGGSPNRIRVTVTAADAAVAAGDAVTLYQPIEGLRVADLRLGSASAKTITVQFGCKGPAGTYCLNLRNSAVNRAYSAEYTITAPEANTDVIKSVTIALDQTGAWLVDNNLGLFVQWTLMAGSTFQQSAGAWAAGNLFATSNQFNFMGSNGNVFELFDVSLTIGATAPTFQMPDYPETLRACQRYWEKTYPYADAVGTVYGTFNGGNAIPSAFVSAAGNFVNVGWFYSVEKRPGPTVTVYSPFTGASTKMRDQTGAVDVAAVVQLGANQKYVYFVVNNVAVAAVNFVWAHITANARL